MYGSHSIYFVNHIVTNQKSHCNHFCVSICPCRPLAKFYVFNCSQIPIIKVDRYITLHFIDASKDELSTYTPQVYRFSSFQIKHLTNIPIRDWEDHWQGPINPISLFLQTPWMSTIKLIIQDSNKYRNYPLNLISHKLIIY